MNQKDADSYNDMMGAAVIPNEALKIDMGVAVSMEEKQAIWPNEEEAKRQEAVNQNGNDGYIYEVDRSIAVERGLHVSGAGTAWDVIGGGSGE